MFDSWTPLPTSTLRRKWLHWIVNTVLGKGLLKYWPFGPVWSMFDIDLQVNKLAAFRVMRLSGHGVGRLVVGAVFSR